MGATTCCSSQGLNGIKMMMSTHERKSVIHFGLINIRPNTDKANATQSPKIETCRIFNVSSFGLDYQADMILNVVPKYMEL